MPQALPAVRLQVIIDQVLGFLTVKLGKSCEHDQAASPVQALCAPASCVCLAIVGACWGQAAIEQSSI